MKRGDIEAIVTATGDNTFLCITSALVASVNQRGNFQKLLVAFIVGLCFSAGDHIVYCI